jgi:DNA ligase-associated metallophosphoesterase
VLLAAQILKRDPHRIVSLGDSFHDSEGFARLTGPDRARIQAMQRGREWIWVSGNHDPELPADIGGKIAEEVKLHELTFRHTPKEGIARGEVAGHLHPAAKVRRSGRSVRCRAFVTDGTRVVMPAFGVLTGGLNVLDGAFTRLLLGTLCRAVLIGHGKLFPVAFGGLSRD